jgi:hypothetical protein
MSSLDFDLFGQEECSDSLSLLLLQPPIAFHRAFVDLTGSVTAALFLSTALDISEQEGHGPHKIFDLNHLDIQHRSGLSRKEQATARERLKDLKLITEVKAGLPPKIKVQIHEGAILKQLSKHGSSNRVTQASYSATGDQVTH